MGISTFPAASGGITTRTLKQAVFNSSGTWTYPSSSKFDGTVEVTCVGGGGGAGGAINRSGSTFWMGGGAGGGGQVILRRQLSVLGAGNQTVTVGNGGVGYYEVGGLFGQISSFGSGYIRNLYPDPALTKGLHSLNSAVGVAAYPDSRSTGSSNAYCPPQFRSSGTNPPQPPAGNTSVPISLVSNAAVYSQFMSVKGSTEYRLVFAHTFNVSGGTNVTAHLLWYNSDGTNISSTSFVTFTTQTSSGTWTTVSGTGTSPSTAAYARICWNASGGAADYRLNGITFAESAANVTAVAYGGNSGYAWTGVPDNSYTLNENETLIAAQGGGGGWGGSYRISSNGGMYLLPGHAGYTSGGMGINWNQSTIASSDMIITGCGGGAGGNARGVQTPIQESTVNTFTIQAGSGRFGFVSNDGNTSDDYKMYAAAHSAAAFVGSDSYRYSISSAFPFTTFGENGIGIEGYGYGGVGMTKYSTTTYGSNFISSGSGIASIVAGYNNDFSPTSNDYQAAFRAKPNSGNGGSGWIATVTNNNTNYNGPRGGSGLVIVRWYE